ncbi:CheW domain-containing protein [Romeria aff. gracilis LEGE 07310]|uniref:CheW domain-containing protein n=1 Tax=Vasconcelosia minhoensis LEGE 07310 TaxID=915328 RepID=A0A8J7AHK5_9CYAN|nr:CheW domain-containing protein [Romeria gracilis]MBE9079256.1 CheW domain-containing protein [Romeria aff. gracilis LEGE 07310]
MIGNPDFQTGIGQDQAPELQELETPEGELHLRFYVTSGDEFALPATGIRRIIEQAPDRITPVPNVSPLLLGTLNEQGRVIWVADLGQFLGHPKPMSTDRAEIPVIAVEEQGTMLGLAVDHIVGTDWLDIDSVQVSRDYSDAMAPFLKGEWVLDAATNRSLRLLDHLAILRSARWAA